MERTSRCSGVSLSPSFPVVTLIFLMACSQVGTIKSMGIYLEDISWSLGTTSTDIGVALGLFTAFSYFPAALIAALYRWRSIRRVILISGSCLASLGVILTAFATNNALMAVYLTIAGLGQCMLTMSSILALDNLTSNENFNLLFGVGMSGFGVGMVLLPFLADVLRQSYGWRGGLLILGGLMANLIPCAVAVQVAPSLAQEHPENIDDFQDSGPSEEAPSLFQKQITDQPEDVEKSGPSEIGWSKNCEHGETAPLCLKSSRLENVQDDHEQELREEYSLTKCTAAEQIILDSPEKEEEDQRAEGVLNGILTRFRHSDFYIDPVINVLFVGSLVYGVLYCGWHAFLVPHALQRGYSIQSTVVMTLFASIGNFLGRLVAGALSGRLANPLILYQGAALLNAFAILCDAFIHQYYVMSLTACLSAVSIAGMSVLGPLVLKQRASPTNFGMNFAVNEMFFGLGTFIGGYLSGLVGEIFSSYNATFKLLAVVDILVFVLMLPVLLIKRPINL